VNNLTSLRNPDKPIFTLPVPRSRIYIVTDPSLAVAVQRASRTLSFTPLVPDITQRVLGLDDDTVTIVRQHIDPEPGEPRGFLADIHDLVYTELGPGETLNELSLDAAKELARQVDEYARVLREERGGQETVDLLRWIRHFVAMATANFLYGDENPLALHPELESAFWDFDHGLGALLMAGTSIFPSSITARKAHRGREALVAAFEEYLTLGRHMPGAGAEGRTGGGGGASSIVQKRVAVALQHGWTLRAAARSELSFLFAGIVNTATTTFWVILQLFASSTTTPDGDDDSDGLLSAVRSELLSSSQRPSGNNKDKEKEKSLPLSLSLEKLRTASPTLQAVLRECLRQNSDACSTRLVKESTTLSQGTEKKYHFVKGGIVQIAGGTMHADPRIWGPDVGVFNPYRFFPNNNNNNAAVVSSLSSNSSDDKKPKPKPKPKPTVHPAAFRAFGGGKTLCPGRHFAVLEIQALVALLVTQFDIEGGGGGGAAARKIRVPAKEDGVLPVHVLEPKERVEVTVRVREEGRGIAVFCR
jgi:cytochrome P450